MNKGFFEIKQNYPIIKLKKQFTKCFLNRMVFTLNLSELGWGFVEIDELALFDGVDLIWLDEIAKVF